jgi:hypothetical protein
MTDAPERPRRDRMRLAAAALVVIPLGLLTRANILLPALIATYGGDTLYATLVYLLVALLWPQGATWHISLIALSICVVVELSQLAQAPWLDPRHPPRAARAWRRLPLERPGLLRSGRAARGGPRPGAAAPLVTLRGHTGRRSAPEPTQLAAATRWTSPRGDPLAGALLPGEYGQ